MKRNTYAVIMAGGIGSRFWPYSRAHHPKQFIDILDTGQSLIQMTNQRLLDICPQENVYVVTNDSYYNLVREHLPDMKDDQILLEPEGRNTAPCIAYASYKIGQKDPKAVVVVSPADHIVMNEKQFSRILNKGVKEAGLNDNLITIGIKPTRPEPGYGYIKFIKNNRSAVKKVKSFTEKPKLEKAKKFFNSGDYVWNAGIFIWNIDSIKNAFREQLPNIDKLFAKGAEAYYTKKEKAFIKKIYPKCESISIDYGIMQNANNVYVILGSFGWSDVGSWNSLYEIKKKDRNRNVIQANAMVYGANECLIQGPPDKLIVVQGLKGYLVADCDNVILICEKENEKQFRAYLRDVKAKKLTDYI